jgi:hypothetical protein
MILVLAAKCDKVRKWGEGQTEKNCNNTLVLTALATMGKYNVNGCPPPKPLF